MFNFIVMLYVCSKVYESEIYALKCIKSIRYYVFRVSLKKVSELSLTFIEGSEKTNLV